MSYNKRNFIFNTTILFNFEGQIKYRRSFFFKGVITYYKFLTKKGL
jgi:hypothetical protein